MCLISPLEKMATIMKKYLALKVKQIKMVFSFKNKWVILDKEELWHYMKDNKLNDVNLDELIKNLEWDIIIKKLKEYKLPLQ